MTSPFTVIISYDQMVLLIMALFMFVGAIEDVEEKARELGYEV